MASSRYHFLQNQRPSLGGELGSALGTGLGTGLAALAESKLDKMLASNQRAEDKQKLVSLGIPEHEAEYLSHQDPDVQWQSARQWLIAGGAPEEMLPRTLDDEWNINPEQEQAAQQQVQQMLGQQQPQGPMGALEQLGQGQPQQQPGVTQALGMQPKAALQAAPVLQPELQEGEGLVTSPKKKPKSLGEAFKLAEAKEPKRDAAAEKERLQREKEVAKETLPTYNQTVKAAHAAQRSNARLDKMEKLIDEGSLPFAATYNAFEFLAEDPIPIPIVGPLIGLVTHSLGGIGKAIQRSVTSRDTEQFEKLSGEFIRDAKDIFGARITDADLRAFMKTVPTLAQTDNGKKAVIRNIRELNDLAIERNQVMKQIIKENGGKRPANMDILIDERLEPELNRITNEMKMSTRVL